MVGDMTSKREEIKMASKLVALCPICRVTRHCEATGCLKCHLNGRVA